MTRIDHVAKLIRRGQPPSLIATEWSKSYYSVSQHLWAAVGRRLISRSEILLTLDEQLIEWVESAVERLAITDRWDLKRALNEEGRGHVHEYDIEDGLLYFDLRGAPLADMFEALCLLEQFLHALAKLVLQEKHGPDHWWTEIPISVRKQCVTRREDDAARHDPYSYTTFIDLHDIYKDHWTLLSERLSDEVRRNRKEFLSDLVRLNLIRNRVMHPVRQYRPAREDFEFVTGFLSKISRLEGRDKIETSATAGDGSWVA